MSNKNNLSVTDAMYFDKYMTDYGIMTADKALDEAIYCEGILKTLPFSDVAYPALYSIVKVMMHYAELIEKADQPQSGSEELSEYQRQAKRKRPQLIDIDSNGNIIVNDSFID